MITVTIKLIKYAMNIDLSVAETGWANSQKMHYFMEYSICNQWKTYINKRDPRLVHNGKYRGGGEINL